MREKFKVIKSIKLENQILKYINLIFQKQKQKTKMIIN